VIAARLQTGQDYRVSLPPDAYPEDVRVIQNGLRADDREWFEAARLLLDPMDEMPASGIVADHPVQVPPERWVEYSELLGCYPGFGAGTLSRRDLFALARHSLTVRGSAWIDLLVASYAWGYGDNVLGPARLKRVLRGHNGTPAPDPSELQERLDTAVRLLEDQGSVAAYAYLRDGQPLAHWAAAFVTKFLYFAGHVADVNGDRPLILDKVLARRMRWFWRRRFSPQQAAIYERHWATYRWSTYRYQVYLTFLGVAAEQLAGTSPTRWSPDLVELILYQCDPSESINI